MRFSAEAPAPWAPSQTRSPPRVNLYKLERPLWRMVEVNKVLEEIGLGRNEIRVYMTCLRSGPLSVPQMRRKMGLPESTVRDNMGFLMKKGLVSRTVRRDNLIEYHPRDPQVLANELKKRLARLQAAIAKLKTARKTSR